ncbi:uncharacterized protein P174DRAFT_464677 [Aspergillus novofumigatus IBT 16806]|uniref:Dimethylallyl tryptophan synthase n=1 Tax=Aspergillus novofumigatus (strain IBT 16806) TaxID=1392255 RepID=A0A2I1BU89_ASPN1|nr:uncharacterized protein P174DRAFT_464677 [Aspergillus novofumigatus IBT 16806]PKX88945.1 hypothetical protein P174DRAFT_464677 [Aspergillus novofumigatus IBT 16806]
MQRDDTESTSESLPAYDTLTKCFTFSGIDQHEWWTKTAPTLGKLLRDAKYDPCQQLQYLYLFGMHIIPMLGPFPNARPGLYRSILGGLGCLEFNQNFTQLLRTVRIAFEPTTLSRLKCLSPHLITESVLALDLKGVRKVDHDGVFGDLLSLIEHFLRSAPSSLSVFYLSCDLSAPRNTRFKIYITEFQVGSEQISYIWTLGGTLQDPEMLTGLRMLGELLGDPPHLLPLLFNFEILPHKPLPQVKIYVSLTGINDMTITDIWGWAEHT